MATDTTTSTTDVTTLTTQASVTQQTKNRIADYATFVSPDVAKATNGLVDQLIAGEKNRLKF